MKVIFDETTVGIYNYKHRKDFVRFVHQMIEINIRVNNEFYVAPVYKEMIDAGMKISHCDVGTKIYGLCIPEDLDYFVDQEVSKRVF